MKLTIIAQLLSTLIAFIFVVMPLGVLQAEPPTQNQPQLMLDIPVAGVDANKVNFSELPRLQGEHAVVSAGDEEWKFRLHNYLAHHDGQYWCFWSHGPVIEDLATQHLRYSTSQDGLKWTEPQILAGPPQTGYGYIARGLWIREGELLALASLFEAPTYHGGDLKLVAFRWNKADQRWDSAGQVWDNTLNNFAPKKLPSGEWMMTRRESDRTVSLLVGGVKSIDDWRVIPLVAYKGQFGLAEEPYWWTLPDGRISGLFRDNSGSKRLLRAFSDDEGRSWTPLSVTNFPDATSKFFSLKSSAGDQILVSNANPKRRNPLCLSVSPDGLVFNRLAVLPIPATQKNTLQYPHMIEHDGSLLIAFSRDKTAIEVVKIPLTEIEKLKQ